MLKPLQLLIGHNPSLSQKAFNVKCLHKVLSSVDSSLKTKSDLEIISEWCDYGDYDIQFNSSLFVQHHMVLKEHSVGESLRSAGKLFHSLST